MARYRPHNREQAIMAPIVLEQQLQSGTMEHAIDHLITHHIDLTAFDRKYRNDEVGRPAIDPAILLKVVFFGYSRGLLSSREIARACEENVVFMALADETKPHYTVIADFVSGSADEIDDVFRQFLLLCSELDLIGGELFAVDGCKLSSNASKEWSGTRKELERKKEKIQVIVQSLLAKHKKRDAAEKERIPERVERLEEKMRRIEAYLESNGERIGGSGKEVKSNITDPESAKMKCSRGVLQGYNGIAVVDEKAQVVVHAAAFGSGQEHDLLEPMLDGAERNLAELGKTLEGAQVVADTNYHTKFNCQMLEDRGIDGYVPDSKFRKRDSRFENAVRFKPVRKRKYGYQDFRYDAERDIYTCPAGEELKLEKSASRVKGGYVMRQYIARGTDCRKCALKANCLSNPLTPHRSLSIVLEKPGLPGASMRMMKKIDSPKGRDVYSKRMKVVEPVFANMTYAKGMNRITLRGRVKATAQWMLYAIVNNIGKISRANYMGLAYG